MSEEEKNAINIIKGLGINISDGKSQVIPGDEATKISTSIYTILNLIGKQQKELNNIKEIEKSHQEENGKLRVELEQEKARNEKLQYKIDEKELIIDGMKEDRRIAIEEIREEYYISKDKIRKIVDEHIPKQPNIITGEMEYTPNTNANSFLVQDILELLEEK